MPTKAPARRSASFWGRAIRQRLREGGSAEHAADVQWFFKEEVRSHGWYTGDLRRLARDLRREIEEPALLLEVAEGLFRGEVLEEKNVAVLLLEKFVGGFGEPEFRRLERWLDTVSTWADHDALVMTLLGPLIEADPRRAARIHRWARSPNRWYRRAAAVSLIPGARRHKLFDEISRMTRTLLEDQDDMVRKGLGWLLRETAKADPARAVPLLMMIRSCAPRLVLRTACETLPAAERRRILKS